MNLTGPPRPNRRRVRVLVGHSSAWIRETERAPSLTAPAGPAGTAHNHAADGQLIAFIYPAKWLGVSHPISTVQYFVLAPLRSITGQPGLQAAVSTYQTAQAKTQTAWTRCPTASASGSPHQSTMWFGSSGALRSVPLGP
jgi:hypothetical protein